MQQVFALLKTKQKIKSKKKGGYPNENYFALAGFFILGIKLCD
jgi:hypothetical protein|tara:strand:+ start:1391 stop:1519 length:129 start_codon:yes stop_codon:yes gene_type:complete